MKECKLTTIKEFGDSRGKLAIIDSTNVLNFKPKRMFYIYNVPEGEVRGEHANIDSNFIMVALSGSVEVEVDNGKTKESFVLDRPNKTLFIPNGTWKTMKNFKNNAVLLVIADTDYNKEEYITDYNLFRKYAQ